MSIRSTWPVSTWLKLCSQQLPRLDVRCSHMSGLRLPSQTAAALVIDPSSHVTCRVTLIAYNLPHGLFAFSHFATDLWASFASSANLCHFWLPLSRKCTFFANCCGFFLPALLPSWFMDFGKYRVTLNFFQSDSVRCIVAAGVVTSCKVAMETSQQQDLQCD